MYGRCNKPFTKGVKVVHRRKTANANVKMTKKCQNDKKMTKRRTIVDKTLYRKKKIQHHQPHYKTVVSWGALEGKAAPAPIVVHVVLLLLSLERWKHRLVTATNGTYWGSFMTTRQIWFSSFINNSNLLSTKWRTTDSEISYQLRDIYSI